MPSRSRTTTTTVPVGRRPKVAGMRDPRRRGVTGGSTPAAGPDAPDDAAADTTAADLAGTTTPELPDTASSDTASSDTADAAPAAVVGKDRDDPDDGSSPAPAADAADERPTTPRRSGTAVPNGSSSRRGGGTALLDRPAPAAAPAPRAERLPPGLTRWFTTLGASPTRLIAVLAGVLVVCLVLATVAVLAARADRAAGQPYANQAVVDVAGTAEVVGQSRSAIESILSYDFTKLDESVNAARDRSTGDFTTNYLAVFERTIRGPATDQKLRQSASVLNIGVRDLSGDRATLMALVQFTAVRTTTNQTTNAPGLLSVQMVKQDGRWKISELKPL